ncbi:hypothetical protein, partial [Frankia sp. R82]|uniref:hypothetical protein n=1 Tax=Frankia sp. R82 TaxID=2950553 RepID=UPI0020434220
GPPARMRAPARGGCARRAGTRGLHAVVHAGLHAVHTRHATIEQVKIYPCGDPDRAGRWRSLTVHAAEMFGGGLVREHPPGCWWPVAISMIGVWWEPAAAGEEGWGQAGGAGW